jgi:YHS domain-containing protein
MGATALAKDLVNVDEQGVALQGYDPVAFFTDAKPVSGSDAYVASYHGATYHFASAEHRDLFVKSPEHYAPSYGGFCAYGVSQGHTAPVKIETWQIVGGHLVLNYDLGVKANFDKHQKELLHKADGNWKSLVNKEGK